MDKHNIKANIAQLEDSIEFLKREMNGNILASDHQKLFIQMCENRKQIENLQEQLDEN